MSAQPQTPHRLLFLCSGNYYRSRFAELLFNALANEARVDWRAFSRGLVADRENGNTGPISIHALRGLAERGVHVPEPIPFPVQLDDRELGDAGLVVALKEAEHRPLLAQRFPLWTGRVEYWHIDDLDCAPPGAALTELEQQVRALLLRLTSR